VEIIATDSYIHLKDIDQPTSKTNKKPGQ